MSVVHLTTANICGNPLRPRRAVRRRMRKALRQTGATFGQEVARSNRWRRSNYSAEWHAAARAFGKTTAGGPREVPVSLPDGEIISWETPKVHDGKRGVSPARYITVVKAVVGGRAIGFVNCHPVSKPRRGVPYAKWRIRHWNLYIAQVIHEVSALRAEGYTVFVGGDMNKRLKGIPVIHPQQRLIATSGLDHLWVVPADGRSVGSVRSTKIARTVLMDHPILITSVEVR